MLKVLGAEVGDVHPRTARATRRDVPSRHAATSIDERHVTLKNGERLAGRPGRRRHRCPAGDRARGAGGPRHRSRGHGGRVSRDERSAVSLRPATSRAGRNRTPASASASSTGWWPNARGRRRRATSLAGGSGLTPSRSSGPSSTSSVSRMSVTPSASTAPRSMGNSTQPQTARSPIGAAARNWPWRSCIGIWRGSARKWNSRRQPEANPQMKKRTLKVGDHVTWNSEAGHVSGTIIKVHTECELQGIHAPCEQG